MDFRTWSPFQSQETKEICGHMTESEKVALMRLGFKYGIWIAITLVIPMALAVSFPSPLTIGFAIILLIVFLICLPIWLKIQKIHLCSTEWAKTKGYIPDQLKLFGCRKR
jgi:hypothetical protein